MPPQWSYWMKSHPAQSYEERNTRNVAEVRWGSFSPLNKGLVHDITKSLRMSWQNSWIASCSRQCSSNQNYAFIFFMKKAIAVSFRVVMAIIGPIMLTCANVLIFGVMFVFVNFILPKLTENSPIAYILHLSFGVFLFVNVVFNYWCCAFTSPGYPTQCESPESLLGQSTVMMEGRRVVVLRNKFEISPAVSYRYCRHCQCIKPPRAHHDRWWICTSERTSSIIFIFVFPASAESVYSTWTTFALGWITVSDSSTTDTSFCFSFICLLDAFTESLSHFSHFLAWLFANGKTLYDA